MKVIFTSAECYPAAKVGGLADVVGALPKYLNQAGHQCDVVMPKYHNQWILSKETEEIFIGGFVMGWERIYYRVEKMVSTELGFDLYFIDIPGKFDRPGVYAHPGGGYYEDEYRRNISFQRAILQWLSSGQVRYDLIHCHDHHTGLIPFFVSHGYEFQRIRYTPTVFTIHNAAYQGIFGWEIHGLLPAHDLYKSGLLEWDGLINSLAAGVKASWRATSVSENYMNELQFNGFGLEWLFQYESGKCSGIINGIDSESWDPSIDPMLYTNLKRSAATYKSSNKKALCKELGLDPKLPLYIFIGRMVMDKGVDYLIELFFHLFHERQDTNCIILGSGDPYLEGRTRTLEYQYPDNMKGLIMYNEEVAHKLYAAADFLWMPSRFEPCGLNQMYAMRYGTIPIVRATGGLADTVQPITDDGGNGFLIYDLTLDQGINAMAASIALYEDKQKLKKVREHNMGLDLSWDVAAQKYIDLYQQLI